MERPPIEDWEKIGWGNVESVTLVTRVELLCKYIAFLEQKKEPYVDTGNAGDAQANDSIHA